MTYVDSSWLSHSHFGTLAVNWESQCTHTQIWSIPSAVLVRVSFNMCKCNQCQYAALVTCPIKEQTIEPAGQVYGTSYVSLFSLPDPQLAVSVSQENLWPAVYQCTGPSTSHMEVHRDRGGYNKCCHQSRHPLKRGPITQYATWSWLGYSPPNIQF